MLTDGVNDPLQFYCKRQDRLRNLKKNWNLGGKIIKNNKKYFIIDFRGKDLKLTLGTIGFFEKKKPYLNHSNWKPYFFHVDATHEVIEKGETKIAMVKNDIIHMHSDSIEHLLKKLKRNIYLFYLHKNKRKHNWAVHDKKNLYIAIIKMSTLIVPIIDALKGYFFVKKDIAWLVHPYLCLRTTIIYSFETLKKIFGYYK